MTTLFKWGFSRRELQERTNSDTALEVTHSEELARLWAFTITVIVSLMDSKATKLEGAKWE